MNREITPVTEIEARVRLPGSKYIANRLLPMCALAKSPSRLTNLVVNDDINTAIEGLSQLGYHFEREEDALVVIPRESGITAGTSLYTHHSGTFSRFVSAIAALESFPVKIGCSDKMATRPMDELFNTLRQLDVKIDSANQCLPATVTGPLTVDRCTLDASRSSQYLSALLIIAPRLSQGLKVELEGELVSAAYVEMTCNLMAKLGVQVTNAGRQYEVAADEAYQGIDYSIPCDPVSSTYFMGLAAISGGRVVIEGFDFESVQGEAQFMQVLNNMGVDCKRHGNDLLVQGRPELQAIDVDMGSMPDAVQTLAVIACFAKGITRIRNIAHLAYKESNRIEDTATELRKAGIRVETTIDSMTIHGSGKNFDMANHQIRIETHEDHRMAMSMALLGAVIPQIVIEDAQVVEKSFPGYWDCMQDCGLVSRLE